MIIDWIRTAQMAEGIIAGLVLLLTLVGLWKTVKVTQGIKWLWVKTFGATHHKLLTNMEILLNEFIPNGGSSLKDAVNRIEDNQESYYALVSARLDADHQAIVLTDVQGKVTNISRAFQEYTGMTLNMMEGDGWVNLIHPEDRKQVEENWKAVVANKREMNEDQRYIRPDNGQELKVHIKVYRQRDSKKILRGFLAVVHPLEDERLCPYSTDPEKCAAAFHRTWDCRNESGK